MAHAWDRGVLNASSWHGLEEIGALTTAADMITAGEWSGAWPIDVGLQDLFTAGGLKATSQGVVGRYKSHDPRVLGVVGGRYQATTPDQWRELVTAAVDAGAKPTGAFSLRGGSRVLATFDVGERNGFASRFVLTDSFDGSGRLMGGGTEVRVVCQNTYSAAFANDGRAWAKLRHTASLTERVQALAEGIAESIQTGQKVRDTYAAAEQARLDRDGFENLFDQLFPRAADDAGRRATTIADTRRCHAIHVAQSDLNRVDDGRNVATLWNAATYLVDRQADGSARKTRGGQPLDSLLFGARAARIADVQHIVEVCMADGTTQAMTVSQATEAGVDAGQLGSSLLASMIDEASN